MVISSNFSIILAPISSFLTGYKLEYNRFVIRMIELRHGAEVFMHYLKCYADYGDIIKEAISKSRNLDQVTSAHTLVLALRKQYQYLLVHHGGALDKSSQDFAQLKGS